MVNVADIRHQIGERLRTISGLVVLDHWPDNLTGTAVVVQPARDPFMARAALASSFWTYWDVTLLVALATGGEVRAQQTLDGYLDDTGSLSIWEALEGSAGTAQTLGGEASDLEVQQVLGYGALYTIGTTVFTSVTWRVRVY